MKPCDRPASFIVSGEIGASGAGLPSQSATAWRVIDMAEIQFRAKSIGTLRHNRVAARRSCGFRSGHFSPFTARVMMSRATTPKPITPMTTPFCFWNVPCQYSRNRLPVTPEHGAPRVGCRHGPGQDASTKRVECEQS